MIYWPKVIYKLPNTRFTFGHYGFIYTLKTEIYQRHASKTKKNQIVRKTVSCHLVYAMIYLKHLEPLKSRINSTELRKKIA